MDAGYSHMLGSVMMVFLGILDFSNVNEGGSSIGKGSHTLVKVVHQTAVGSRKEWQLGRIHKRTMLCHISMHWDEWWWTKC